MIYNDRTYRTEEVSGRSQAIDSMAEQMRSFSGGSAIANDFKENMGAIEPPPAPVETPPLTPEQTLVPAGTETPAAETPETPLTPEAPIVVETTPVTPEGTETPAAEASTEDDGLTIESPMFGGKKVITKGTGTEPLAGEEVNPAVSKYIKDTYGFEDASKMQTQIDTWKENETKVTDLEKTVQSNNMIFEGMPTEMYNAVKSYFQGDKDWRKHMTEAPALDFKQSIENQGSKDLIEAFYPGQFTAEDWEEFNDAEGDANVKKSINFAISGAKEKFVNKQNEINNYQQNLVNQEAAGKESYSNSIATAMSSLKTAMPDLNDDYLAGITSKLSDKQNVISMFFNEDGTLKDDAGAKLVMAQDGKNLLDQYQKHAERAAKNKATQGLLNRTSETPPKSGGSSTETSGGKNTFIDSLREFEKGFNQDHSY